MSSPLRSGSVPQENRTDRVGSTVSHYRVIEKLGGGGMGVVYKAEDTDLGRVVALKFLPDDVANDCQALSRFQREAKAASSLNHPNIVTIYELGCVNGTHYIAMEMVRGETLRGLLDGGPLPFRKAVAIATQVADALAKAHEIGLVHRDLKPENLMVAEDNTAKFWILVWPNSLNPIIVSIPRLPPWQAPSPSRGLEGAAIFWTTSIRRPINFTLSAS